MTTPDENETIQIDRKTLETLCQYAGFWLEVTNEYDIVVDGQPAIMRTEELLGSNPWKGGASTTSYADARARCQNEMEDENYAEDE